MVDDVLSPTCLINEAKTLTILALVVGLASCQGYVPKNPDPELVLPGNYKAISDCAFVKLRYEGWTMTALDTQNMIEFNLIPGDVPVSRIEVIGAPGNSTRLIPYQMKTLTGRGVGSFEPLDAFRECSQAVSLALPKSPS